MSMYRRGTSSVPNIYRHEFLSFLEHQGTADAIRRCLWVLEEYPVAEFLVLPGHHLYKMDYQKLIEYHRNRKSDITIVASNGTTMRGQDRGFGIVQINTENQVIQYSLKADKEPRNYTDTVVSFAFHLLLTCQNFVEENYL